MSEKGTCYFLHEPLGDFVVGPLLRALSEKLPRGSTVQFVAPLDQAVERILVEHGSKQQNSTWSVRIVPGSGTWSLLVATAEAANLRRLCVWLLGEMEGGGAMIEAEDGNDYIWLTNRLPEESRQGIVESAGGYRSLIEGAGHLP